MEEPELVYDTWFLLLQSQTFSRNMQHCTDSTVCFFSYRRHIKLQVEHLFIALHIDPQYSFWSCITWQYKDHHSVTTAELLTIARSHFPFTNMAETDILLQQSLGPMAALRVISERGYSGPKGLLIFSVDRGWHSAFQNSTATWLSTPGAGTPTSLNPTPITNSHCSLQFWATRSHSFLCEEPLRASVCFPLGGAHLFVDLGAPSLYIGAWLLPSVRHCSHWPQSPSDPLRSSKSTSGH